MKKLNRIKYILVFIVAIIAFAACKKSFFGEATNEFNSRRQLLQNR